MLFLPPLPSTPSLPQAKLEDMGEESCGQVPIPGAPLSEAQRRELHSMRTWLLARQQDEVSVRVALGSQAGQFAWLHGSIRRSWGCIQLPALPVLASLQVHVIDCLARFGEGYALGACAQLLACVQKPSRRTHHHHLPLSPPAAFISSEAIEAYMVVLQAEGLLVPTAQNDCWQVGIRDGVSSALKPPQGRWWRLTLPAQLLRSNDQVGSNDQALDTTRLGPAGDEAAPAGGG